MESKNERTERLQVALSSAELTELDTFRFGHRMPNRSAALRKLLRLGLVEAERRRESDPTAP